MSKKVKNKNKSWHYAIVAYLIAGYVYSVGFFTKFIYKKDNQAQALDDNQKVIYAFWHNQQSLFSI